MPSEEYIAHQQELLDINRENLQLFLNQLAIHTYAYVPPATIYNIRKIREDIRQIKRSLRKWNIAVEDLPTDEEQSDEVPTAGAVQASHHIPTHSIDTHQDVYHTPLVLGVMLDVSQDMKVTLRSLPKRSGLSLRSMNEAVENLRNQIVALRRSKPTKGVLPNISLFLYAFGVSHIQHTALGFLRDAGLYTGEPVNDSPVRDLFAEVALEEGLPKTPTADILDENWDSYRQGIDNNLADLIFGGPPSLYTALQLLKERVHKELQTKRVDNIALLLISSGKIEVGRDRQLVNVANEIKDMGADIIVCYIHKNNVLAPYRLYDNPNSNWPSEARLLFECASPVKAHSRFSKTLVNAMVSKSWKMSDESRFLVQVNQSKLLKDVIDSINNSMPQ